MSSPSQYVLHTPLLRMQLRVCSASLPCMSLACQRREIVVAATASMAKKSKTPQFVERLGYAGCMLDCGSWLLLPFFACDLFDFFDAGLDEPGSVFRVDACTVQEAHQMI